MVVVPTENEVRLHYGRSGSELLFYALTLVGIGLLVFFRLRGDERFDDLMRPARSRWRRTTRFLLPAGYTEGDAEFDAPAHSLPVTEQPPNRSPVDAESSPWAPDPPLA